jgi:hypothetical protein
MTRRSTTYETRLLKYAHRGFAIGVTGLDLDMVTPFFLSMLPVICYRSAALLMLSVV